MSSSRILASSLERSGSVKIDVSILLLLNTGQAKGETCDGWPVGLE